MAEPDQRLFVAVPLPPDAVEACAALIERVANGPHGRAPRWVSVPNLHLTLRFLGGTPPGRIPAVTAAVDLAAGGRTAFDVSLAGAGAFPDTRRPRALWLGIERGAGELGDLARRLDDALVPLGWPPDARAYRPHLTVARLDAAPRADGIAAVEELIGAADGWRTSFRAHEVVLFRSHLGRGPARHEALHRVPLRA